MQTRPFDLYLILDLGLGGGANHVRTAFVGTDRARSSCQGSDGSSIRRLRDLYKVSAPLPLWVRVFCMITSCLIPEALRSCQFPKSTAANCQSGLQWAACRLISAVGADFLPPSCNALRLALACCRFLRPTLAALQRTVAGQTIRSRCCSGGSSGVLPRSTHAPVGANTRTACRSRSTSD